uniref:Vesicle-fusing ATPase n=1 Tax=Ditylenchus dipsaci TaxID=166011 RepID=A0A915DYE3_9BILA
MGINHLRGILLHGPPGTGKTLLARKIAEMLNAREPKLVNGPEIFDMYLGQSESNIRKLFADAEKEWAAVGNNSRLHVIIFDEFDSIVPNRRHLRSTGRTDSRVVNQLLSKLDGLEQLNNILVIGMTNQLELIDPAILRPGRMEIQMEIHLPDEEGRHQILKIHTQKMRNSNRLAEDVDLAEIAKQCANYSGAEIEGLVRAAQSHAVKRFLGDGKQKKVTEETDTDSLKIISEDFQAALKKDITPHFGNANAMLTHILHRPIIHWCAEISQVLSKGDEAIKQTLAKNGPGFVKILLIGAKQTGKTFLAAEIAKESKMNFVKLVTAASLGRNKISELEQAFDDAAASALSCLFIDNLERIADYSEARETFDNQIVLKLSELIERRPKEGKRLLVIATCSSQEFIKNARLKRVFSSVVQVPSIKEQQHITSVVKSLNLFDTEEMQLFHKHLNQLPTNLELSIQQLLEIVDSVRMEDEEESLLVAGGELGPVKHNKRVEKFFKGLKQLFKKLLLTHTICMPDRIALICAYTTFV